MTSRGFIAGLFLVVAGTAAAQTPGPTITFLEAVPARAVLGQPVALTATVVGPSTGVVLFRDGGQALGQSSIDAGHATFTVATLAVGTHSLTAEFVGDASWQWSRSNTSHFTVDPRPTTIVLAGPTPNPVGVGGTAVVTASLVDATTTDPAGTPGSFTAAPGAMGTARTGHTATLLWSGQVLITGGRDAQGAALATAELFDPAMGTFSPVAAPLNAARVHHAATVLQDGRVLIAGGQDAAGEALASAELYDPRTGAFTALPDTLRAPRSGHTATLLADGKVLLTGGITAGGLRASSMELFDPGAATFALLSVTLATAREGHTATLLADRTSILVAGGNGTSSVELLTYTPALVPPVARSGMVTLGLDLAYHTATLLPDGRVLFTGGYRLGPTDAVAIYQYASLFPFDRFAPTWPSRRMTAARSGHTATLLPDGRVFVCGGSASSISVLGSAELHQPAHDPTGEVTMASTDPTDAIVQGVLILSGTGTSTFRVGARPAAVGTAARTLTVTYAGDATHLAAGPATASLTVVRGTPTIVWPTPSAITYGASLGASQLDAYATGAGDARLTGTFTYDPPAGAVPSAGSQALHVTFTPADGVNYLPTSKTISLTVKKAAPRIAWLSWFSVTYGEPLSERQLGAEATGVNWNTLSGTFTYTPPAGTILPAGAYQPLRVEFTPADPNYATVTGTSYVTVDRATPTLTWPDPADVTYGAPLSTAQLNAVAGGISGRIAGTFTYAPAAGAVLEPGAGQPLSVSFTPSDGANYTAAAATAHLNVRKATPTIAWSAAPITYGTPLSGAQLSASATGVNGAALTGAFAYTPGAGELLHAGGALLEVTFTPDDAAHYSAASGAALLHVSKATPAVAWPAPAPIVQGAALGPAQLDATFTWVLNGEAEPVRGTAVYSPPAGTVLAPGLGQLLTVEFIPDDVLDFDAPAPVSVTLDVLPALAIAPASAEVTAGESTTFTRSGGSGEGVVWTLPTNASGGRITDAGVYTAGPTAGVVDVVRVEDSTGHAVTASVTVRAPTSSGVEPEGDGGGGGGCSSAGTGGAGFPLLAVTLSLALALRRRRGVAMRR